jgi:hypothetical protein
MEQDATIQTKCTYSSASRTHCAYRNRDITSHHILSFLSPTQPQLTFPQPLTFRIPDQVSDLTSPHKPARLITYLPNLLISSHLISSHLISSHLISSHLISSHLISSQPPSPIKRLERVSTSHIHFISLSQSPTSPPSPLPTHSPSPLSITLLPLSPSPSHQSQGQTPNLPHSQP